MSQQPPAGSFAALQGHQFANLTTRYPDDLAEAVSRFNEAVARNHIKLSEEVIACLRADPRLQP